jgi:hypothetical protein
MSNNDPSHERIMLDGATSSAITPVNGFKSVRPTWNTDIVSFLDLPETSVKAPAIMKDKIVSFSTLKLGPNKIGARLANTLLGPYDLLTSDIPSLDEYCVDGCFGGKNVRALRAERAVELGERRGRGEIDLYFSPGMNYLYKSLIRELILNV